MEIAPEDLQWLTDLALEFGQYSARYYTVKKEIGEILKAEGVLVDDPQASIPAPYATRPLIVTLVQIGRMIEVRLEKARHELAERNLKAPDFIVTLEEEMQACKEHVQFIQPTTH